MIKIKGKIDESKWDEEKLKEFIETKITNDIDKYYHTDLELFQVKDSTIEVWVYISDSAPLKLLEENVRDWLKNHIKEEGLTVDNVEIEKSGNGFYVITP